MTVTRKIPPFEKFIVGVDLGQSCDFSTLVAVRMTSEADEKGQKRPNYGIVDLHRWPLKTPYTVIVADLKARFEKPVLCGQRNPLAGAVLVVDRSGVGRGILDMLLAAKLNATLHGLTITGGAIAGTGTAPKRDLIAALIRTLGERRLLIAKGLPLAAVLVKELEAFKATMTKARNEVMGAAHGQHDDLVMAAALGIWHAERTGLPTSGRPGIWTPNTPRSPADAARRGLR